jgi:hypothetical protein
MSLVVAVASAFDAVVSSLWNPTSWFLIATSIVWVAAILLNVVKERSTVFILLVVGVAAIVNALLHVLIGWRADQSGFWVDREALPSVLALLGSSLITFAGVAWSFQKTQERERVLAQSDERERQLRRLGASISEVARAIDHCDQLARRGWRLIDGGLRPLAEPLLERPAEGGATLWFEILVRNRRDGSSAVTEVPATPREVWSALREARRWDDRLVERIESLAAERARRLRRSGEAWLQEYERLRSGLVGLDDALPLDLMPFVDDLELIRDILRPSEHGDAIDGEEAALLLAFALALSGLKAMSEATRRSTTGTAESSPSEPSRKGDPEAMLEELWRPEGEKALSSAVDMLVLAAESKKLDPMQCDVVTAMLNRPTEDGDRSFTRDRHWTDVVRPDAGLGSPDVTTRETALKRDFCADGSGVLFHLVLLMLAPARRDRLRSKDWRTEDAEPEDEKAPEALPADARELWAQIILEMTGPDSAGDDGRDEPRRTAFGGSLRRPLSELAPSLSDPNEGDPADLWRLYDNRSTWEGLSDEEDPSDILSDDHDHEPSGWT